MMPRLVWTMLLVLCLSAEGFAAEREPMVDAPSISPEDRKVVEMLDILELMELVKYMEILKDLEADVEDGIDADKQDE